MTSLPETLVQFRTDLEEAIRREQATRGRQRERRRRIAVLALAAVVAIFGAASAFATVNGFSKLREFLSVEPFALGKQTRTVEGVRFSFRVSHGGWENGPVEKVASDQFRNRGLFVSKSTVGPQGAEAIVFWTGFLHRTEGAPCGTLFGRAIDGSIANVASAIAKAPGTTLLQAPTLVTIGGRRAMHVALRVRQDRGCDPGFFFAWKPQGPRGECWGACWLESNVGDTIRVWIVAVNGTRLFIEAQTTKDAGDAVDREIAEIVRSIHFHEGGPR
jgi:hypothetical protein